MTGQPQLFGDPEQLPPPALDGLPARMPPLAHHDACQCGCTWGVRHPESYGDLVLADTPEWAVAEGWVFYDLEPAGSAAHEFAYRIEQVRDRLGEGA